MTQTIAQATAVALSALVTLGIVAGADGIATREYAAAERVALAPYGQTQVAVQRVVIVAHRADA